MRITGLLGTMLVAAVCATPAQGFEKVPDEVIVQFERGAGPGERAEARADAGTGEPENLGSRGLEVVKIEDGGSVAATIRELEADPAVAHAGPNGIDHLHAVPNDPLFGQTWGLNNTGQIVAGTPGSADADIDAPEAWDIGTGEPSTVIAIMDSGVALNHPDIASQLWQNPFEVAGNGVDDDQNGFVDDVNGYDFVANDPNPTDTEGHGTHVAGTALARGNDGSGVTGVSQRASLMVLRVCEPDPTGCLQSSQIQAINYAAAEGADVLNGSLGGASATENLDRRAAIFSHPNVLYVFSAGNEGDNVDTPPATFPCAHAPQGSEVDNLLCVASTTSTDARSASSNFGPVSVDLGAPGSFVLSSGIFHDIFFDRFEGGAADFTFNWPQNSPAPNSWKRSNEAPLTSFGMTDSPGGNYANNAVHVVSSREVAVPAGFSSCELISFRSRALAAGDIFRVEILRNNAPVFTRTFTPANNTTTAGTATLDIGNSIAGGGNIEIQLTLDADAATTANGVHIDNVRLKCRGNGHEFMSGTSMSSPHVAGAAGLLASRNPGADAQEIRQKLLSTVDGIPALSGLTTTGGRLNIGTAMATMSADTSLTGGPGEGEEIGAPTVARRGSTTQLGAQATFGFSSNDPAASFQCSVDGGDFAACAGSQTVGPLRPGPHSFSARSVDPRGNIDATPAIRTFAVESDPPETKIRKGPKKRTESRKAKFRFTADEPGSTFECRLDRKRFKPCSSPKKLKRLDPKKHKFRVRATDGVGNTDPSPAKKRWRVKR